MHPEQQDTARRRRAAHSFVQLVGGRWTLALLAELTDTGQRYQELRDAVDGISNKVLTETLRRAERDGLISRHLDRERVETTTVYQLTDLGRSLDLLLGPLGEWIEENWTTVESARRRWDDRKRAHK